MLHDKLHRTMTQYTIPIVEEDVRVLRERRHSRNHYNVEIYAVIDFRVSGLIATELGSSDCIAEEYIQPGRHVAGNPESPDLRANGLY